MKCSFEYACIIIIVVGKVEIHVVVVVDAPFVLGWYLHVVAEE